jgi:23S rRNA pseudouridine1911/1915/1917 synthase
MAVHPRGKFAVSHYRVKTKYRAHTLVRVGLESGRTHQIRVHLAHIGYPVFGDPTYGGRLRMPPDASDGFAQALRRFRRQALHAAKLGLIHPVSGEAMEWEVPVPEDFQELIRALEADAKQSRK